MDYTFDLMVVIRHSIYIYIYKVWDFPVQNLFFPSKMGLTGINRFFPVFPVQNWEKLSKTATNYGYLYFKKGKVA